MRGIGTAMENLDPEKRKKLEQAAFEANAAQMVNGVLRGVLQQVLPPLFADEATMKERMDHLFVQPNGTRVLQVTHNYDDFKQLY
jgi:hypothetical protein